MVSRGTIFSLFLLLLAASTPRGADATSVYSMILVGEPTESGDVRAIALGGSTHLFADSLGVLQSNAALLSRIPRVTIGATQYLAIDEARSSEFSERDVSFTFSSFRLAFPILGRFCLALGYTGRYQPGGSFSIRGATDGGDAYTQKYEKSGGLYSVPITVAFNVTRFASAGLTLSFEGGSVQQRWDTTFDESTFAPGATLQKESLNGTGLGGGIVLYPIEGFMLGGTYEDAIDYDADVIERSTQVSLNRSSSATLTLPRRVSAGASWRLSNKLMFLASGRWTDFSKFAGQGYPTADLSAERSFSLGAEYGSGVRVGGVHLPVRLGFNYQELPFEFPHGEKVNKFLVSLGTGIVVRGGRAKLDLAFQAGTVGSMGTNQIEDRLFRVYIGVAGGEVWQRKGSETY